jgi:hypothetical protein
MQRHLDDCPLGPGQYTNNQMKIEILRRLAGRKRSDEEQKRIDAEQNRIVEEIRRIDKLPDSKRKSRRKERLLIQLDPNVRERLEL